MGSSAERIPKDLPEELRATRLSPKSGVADASSRDAIRSQHRLLALQRRAGNRVTGRVVRAALLQREVLRDVQANSVRTANSMPSLPVSEVMPPGVRGEFEGYRGELAATVRARQRETLCVVVRDGSGRYHVLDTGSRPRRTVSPVARLAPGLRYVRFVNSRPPPAREVLQSRLAAAQRAYRDYQSAAQGSSQQRRQARTRAERLYAALMPDAFGVARHEVYIARDPTDRRTGKIGVSLDLGAVAEAGLARLPRHREEHSDPMSILIEPSAFQHGIVFAQSTLAHESTHLAIDDQGLQLRQRWIESRSQDTFEGWLEGRPVGLSELDYELVSERLGGAESSAHVVIYVEQFANLFHQVGDERRMTAALDELGKGSRSWSGAELTARNAALDRFEQYVQALDIRHRRELETYLEAPERQNVPNPRYFTELLERLRRVR